MKKTSTYNHRVTLRRIARNLGKMAIYSFDRRGPGVLCVQSKDLDSIRSTGSCPDAVIKYIPLARAIECIGSIASQEFVRWLLEQYDPASGFIVAVLDGTTVADVFIADSRGMASAGEG